MDIHFCDLCNESVPQADLDQGRAFVRKGRIVCATCDRAMSHHAPSVPASAGAVATPAGAHAGIGYAGTWSSASDTHAPPGGEPHVGHAPQAVHAHLHPAGHANPAAHATKPARSGGLWVALLAIAFTAGAVFVIDERMKSLERRVQDAGIALDARALEIASLQRRAVAAEDAQRDAERRLAQRLEGEQVKREEVAAEVGRVNRESAELGQRLAAVSTSLAELEKKAGSGGFDVEKRIADLSSRVARGEDDTRTLEEKVRELEAGAPVVGSIPVAQPMQPAAEEPAWHAQLAGLKSDSASTRWEAVTALGATRNPETVPYITPMLKDGDIFVRMAAARVLGDMQDRGAVGALIDALEDDETAVREAANIALRTITGKDFKFEPLAVEAERARRVKAWRDWWKKESESSSGS